MQQFMLLLGAGMQVSMEQGSYSSPHQTSVSLGLETELKHWKGSHPLPIELPETGIKIRASNTSRAVDRRFMVSLLFMSSAQS